MLNNLSFSADHVTSDAASDQFDRLPTDRDVSAVFSDETSSSNGSTSATTQSLSLKKLNEFLRATGETDPIGAPKKRWGELTDRSKKNRLDKTTSAVVSLLDVIAPGDGEQLWMLMQETQSVEKSYGTTVDKKYLKALAETYNNATTWDTKRQVLGIFADLTTFFEVQKYLPDVTEYRFKQARLHVLKYGRGAPVPLQRSPRMRIEANKLDHFLTFITSPHVIQDLPFGQRYLTLADGQILECPNVIRSMVPQRIINQYTQLCMESDIKPFSQSTMNRILSVCCATVRKSLKGLDYISSDGAKAFDDLAGVLEKLIPYGIDATFVSSCQAKLKTGKQYIKSDYKVII